MATYQWTGGATGDWADMANWGNAGLPGVGDTGNVENATVTTDGETVANVASGATGALIGTGLTVTGALGAVGVLTLNGGTYKAASANVAMKGGKLSAGMIAATVTGGTVTASGAFAGSVMGGSVMVTGDDTLPQGAIDVAGSTLVFAKTLSVTGTSDLDLGGGITTVKGAMSIAMSQPLPDAATVNGKTARLALGQSLRLGEAGYGYFSLDAGQIKIATTLQIGRGAMAIDGGTLRVGGDTAIGDLDGAGGAMAMSTADGTPIVTFGGAVTIGENGGKGKLVTAGKTRILGDLVVGENGTATAAIDGALSVAKDLTIADIAKSDGSVIASGDTATLTVRGNATIGNAGTGGLTIADATATVSGNMTVGAQSTGKGKLTITGGRLNFAGDTTIGAAAGNSRVAVDDGGVITPGSLAVPGAATNTITIGAVPSYFRDLLTVDGTGSAVTSAGLVVGGGGPGSLIVNNGGAVITTGDAVMGEGLTLITADALLGRNSLWQVGGNLLIGTVKNASVTVQTGSSLTVGGDITLGENRMANGALTVSQPSTVELDGTLVVGASGSGMLTILSGGKVVASGGGHGTVEFGADVGSSGGARVAGANSILQGDTLVLGGTKTTAGGTGGLAVGPGGTVDFTNATIWASAGLELNGGLVNIDGGMLVNNGKIEFFGGTLAITGGITGTGTISFDGSDGTLLLNAAGTSTANRVSINGSARHVDLVGGSGNDLFEFEQDSLRNALGSATIVGGAGVDTLAFTNPLDQRVATNVVLNPKFNNISGVDVIALADDAETSLTLDNAIVASSDNKRLTVEGSTRNDTVNGAAVLAGNTLVFYGNGGNDTITGGQGNNIYDFDDKVGTLGVTNSFTGGTAAHGALVFGTGIGDENLWFQRSGSNLIATVLGTTERATINGWFDSNKSAQLSAIDAGGLTLTTQVAQLVSAMASYAADHPGFNPVTTTSMPNDANLQSAIAAAWHA